MDSEILRSHLHEIQLRELNDSLNQHGRETEFEAEIRSCLGMYLEHFSKPIAALFTPGSPEYSDLVFVNNGDEVWSDERFEGAALYALDRIEGAVRKSIEEHMGGYLADLRTTFAGILMRKARRSSPRQRARALTKLLAPVSVGKKPRKLMSRRGRADRSNR